MTKHTQNTLTRLAAANPVPDLPAVESAEHLRRLIETEGPAAAPDTRGRRSKKSIARAMTAAVAALAAAAAGLVLADGSSAPGVNIAAAAYAATSSGSGVLEARFVEHLLLPGSHSKGSHYRREATFRYREWLDASRGLRREQRTLPALLTQPPPFRVLDRNARIDRPLHVTNELVRDARIVHVTSELASSPGWIETWGSLARQRHVIHRFKYSPDRTLAGVPEPPPDNALAQAPEGISTYRQLYRERTLELVGRERWHGRLLWKLEGDVAFAATSFRSKLIPLMTLVVLVDPNTFLPVVQRVVTLGVSHRHDTRTIQSESDLIGYRHLPGDAASEALLKLSAQHPHARVIVERSDRLPAPAGRRGERSAAEALRPASARARHR